MKSILMMSIAVLVFLSAATAQTPCDDFAKYPVRFAILGDRTGGHQDHVYDSVVAEVERMRPDFVMTVGDQIEGYTSDTAQMRTEWDEYLGIVEPLTMPIHYTPGNHDITYDDMEPVYQVRIGKPYYSFDHRGIHFVVMDNSRTESAKEISAEQMSWLVDDLAAHQDACYTMVFFHKPFWYRTLGEGETDAMIEAFKTGGVDAVFSGHFHTYFSTESDGIMYTAIGSSGAGTEESPEGLLYHFGWVTVDGEGIHVAPIKKDAVLAWDVQTLTEARSASKTKSEGITFSSPMPVSVANGGTITTSNDLVTVKLQANMSDTLYSDTLRWEVPEGWKVEPDKVPYTVKAGTALEASFKVTPGDKLYPLPNVSGRLPYAEGKTVKIDKTMQISREVVCEPVDGKVKIDGKLSESFWKQPTTSLFEYDGSPTEQDSTAFYFAYDKDNLYVAAVCRDSKPDSLRATMKKRDDDVYTEDAVGVMIQPVAGPDAYQIYINPLGTIYDQHLMQASDGYWSSDNTWNGEYEVKARRDKKGFVIEMSIPLAQLGGTPKAGEQWPVNFRRKQARLNSAAGLQSPWSYDPTTYGRLVFHN